MPGKKTSKRGRGGGGGRAALYVEHIALEAAEEGLCAGRYVRGKLRINAKARLQAFVAVVAMDRDVFIDGDIDRNRALHGDIVVMELLDEAEWNERSSGPEPPAPTAGGPASSDDGAAAAAAAALTHALWRPLVAADDGAERGVSSADASSAAVGADHATSSADGIAAAVEALALDDDSVHGAERAAAAAANAAANAANKQVRARVVAVLSSPARPPCTGLLVAPRGVPAGAALRKGTRFVLFKPLDSRFPYMKVGYAGLPEAYAADPHAHSATLFAVAVQPLPAGWTTTEQSPAAHVVATIGAAGQIEAETNALLLAEGIEQGPHCAATFAELEKWRGWGVGAADVAQRRDLRQTRVFSIDPTSARDLDDALHVTKLEDGTFEIGVHIADVSHFVTPESSLDADAGMRATTVYLVNKVVPMLPRMLCNEHCSLNPLVERLAFSCIWRMNDAGEVLPPLDRSGGATNGGGTGAWFGRTVIRSCAKLDYTTAQVSFLFLYRYI